MSRLIYAEELLARAEHEAQGMTGDFKDLLVPTLSWLINKTSTAYDIDRVVKKLENLKRIYFLTIANTGDEKLDCAYEQVGHALEKAIEIVKQGGVVDDVCEWEFVSNGEFIRNPHTSRAFSNEPSMQNVYCNTCGKKIKIVGD